jgi:DNA-binding NtrC family response regulator
MELAYLNDLLERTGGRVGEAARQAGLDPRSLYAKMREHGLRKEDFRTREARQAPRTGS